MKNLWKIVYYETSKGECPIEEFINSRNPRNQAKLFAFISLLEERGPNLPRPYADLLEDGIKVPSSEIKTAQRYREDFLKRFKQ